MEFNFVNAVEVAITSSWNYLRYLQLYLVLLAMVYNTPPYKHTDYNTDCCGLRAALFFVVCEYALTMNALLENGQSDSLWIEISSKTFQQYAMLLGQSINFC